MHFIVCCIAEAEKNAEKQNLKAGCEETMRKEKEQRDATVPHLFEDDRKLFVQPKPSPETEKSHTSDPRNPTSRASAPLENPTTRIARTSRVENISSTAPVETRGTRSSL